MSAVEGILTGYRVLELANEWGTYCGKLFADLGADVIKVEPPEGDPLRRRGPFVDDEPGLERSLSFLHYNTNKRGITLNLETSDGRALAKRLIDATDVVVETFRPGYLASIGLGYESLRAANANLVHVSITPFGQDGPHRDYAASDIVIMGMGHMMHLTGEPDGPPVRLGAEQSHHLPSLLALTGAVLALNQRDVIGGGQHLDISMQECIPLYTMETSGPSSRVVAGTQPVRHGNKPERAFPFGGFECADGWVTIAAIEPTMWKALAAWVNEVTGNEDILNPVYEGLAFQRGEQAPLLDWIVTDMTKRFTRHELMTEGQRRGAVVLPVATVADLMTNPQLLERQFFHEADHPVAGRLTYPGGPLRFADSPFRIGRTAPLLGQDNIAIYVDELGLSRHDLATLRFAGAI